jgi:CRISPR-associated protein Csb1
MSALDLNRLQNLVNGTGVAFRVRQRLQPAGGPGDKVFPPTYATGDRTLKYAVEERRFDGADVKCVLLDSVASQANRMEEALQDAWEQGALDFPVISVDFSSIAGLEDLGRITALQAPHRIADAILRDATDLKGTTLFRDLAEGRAYTNATTKNATAVFQLCPTALIFGVWDSTGPKGGLGAKFQRALTAEIVAIGAQEGKKVGSRLDPLGIQANVPLYARKGNHDDWTIDQAEAELDKGKPVPFVRGKADGKGKPSAANHSNIAPTIDTFAGGITFDYAVQTAVLSLPALRRLRFTTALDGSPLTNRAAAESAARVALASLGLAAIVHQRMRGFDLRSRSLLVPEGPLAIELLNGDGSAELVTLDLDAANTLVREAAAAAASAGLRWEREPVRLVPAPKLSMLVRKSREEAAKGGTEEGT